MKHKFEVWMNLHGEWCWHLKASNGRIVCTGGEGYKRRGALIRTLTSLFSGSKHAEALEQVARSSEAPAPKARSSKSGAL